MHRPKNSSASLAGKTCVITGATSGLGRAAARQIGALGATVILTGRNVEAGESVTAGIRRDSGVLAEFIRADISSLAEVRKLAARISKAYPRIDLLINNAGARFDRYQESVDGVELTFATNHLGHFLLTHLLLDNLERSGAGRVISVASVAHRAIEGAEVDWIMRRENYHRRRAYQQSKLANVLFALELARRNAGRTVTSNAIDPGIAVTRFARNNGFKAWVKHLVAHLLKRDLSSATAAAEVIVYAASARDLGGVTGQLIHGHSLVEPSDAAKSRILAEQLWSQSVKLADIEPLLCQAK